MSGRDGDDSGDTGGVHQATDETAHMRGTTSIKTSPSNAIRMFVSASNRRGGFPFDPSNPYKFSAETLAAMDDVMAGRNLPGPTARSAVAIRPAVYHFHTPCAGRIAPGVQGAFAALRRAGPSRERNGSDPLRAHFP